MKISLFIFTLTFAFLSFVNHGSTKTYKRYNIESGILKFKYSHLGIPSKGIIYFGNYGVNERIEMESAERTMTILKISDKQYLMVSDSMALTQDRSNEFLWEKFNPKFSNEKDLDIFTSCKQIKKLHTLNLPCNKHSCFNNFGNHKIKTEIIEWNNIPLKITSGSIQEGYIETFEVTEIDTLTNIPNQLLTIQSYIDTGE